MNQDIFYEVPRLPMFFMMEETTMTRVRAIKYVNGKISAVLADWDVDNIQNEFYSKDHWDDPYEEPFYCMYKSKRGEIVFGNRHLREWCIDLENEYEGRWTADELMERVLSDATMLGCPIFDTVDEARAYVFGIGNGR